MMPPQLPPGLTPEVVNRWLADNPGAAWEDGVREYLLHTSKGEGVSLADKVKAWATNLLTATAEHAQSFATGTPDPSAPSVAPWGQTNLPNMLKMLGDIGLAGAGAGVASVGTGVAGAAARTGAMGALGAAKGEVTGEGPLAGAIQGAGSQGLGEVVRGATALPGIMREHLATLGNRVKWAAKDAVDAVRGIAQEVPPFLRSLPLARGNEDALMRLTQAVPGEGTKRSLGQKYLSEFFADAENMVATALGGYKKDIMAPALRQGMMSAKELEKLGPDVGRAALQAPLTVQQAFDTLKKMTAEAIDAGGGFEAHALWGAVKKGRDELLAQVPAQVAQRYLQDSAVYAKGLVILDALPKGLKGPLVQGNKAVFDAEAFLDHLQAKGLYGYVSNVTNALHRGAEWGAREYIRSAPRGRIYKAGESATFALPGFRVQVRGGYQLPKGNVKAGLVATELAIPGMQSFLPANTVQGYSD